MPCRAACQLFLGWEREWLVGLVLLCVGEPPVPVLFDGCFVCLVAPEGLGGGDVLKRIGLCDDGLGMFSDVE